jgi:hypothetical protein
VLKDAIPQRTNYRLKNMNKVLLIIFIASILLIGCNPGKHVSDFKNIKKSIDTLDVLPIDIQIKTVDYNKEQLFDRPLEKVVKADILDQIKTFLNSKYKIAIADTTVDYSQLCKDLERIRFFIATQSNPLKDEEVPFSFNEIKKNLKHKYSLVLIVRSQYCINFPNRLSTLWVDPMVSPYINQYLFLIDNVNNKIIYFKKVNGDGDISVKLSVEQITLESLRNLYYK